MVRVIALLLCIVSLVVRVCMSLLCVLYSVTVLSSIAFFVVVVVVVDDAIVDAHGCVVAIVVDTRGDDIVVVVYVVHVRCFDVGVVC